MAEIEEAPTRRGPTRAKVLQTVEELHYVVRFAAITHIVIRTSVRPLPGGAQT